MSFGIIALCWKEVAPDATPTPTISPTPAPTVAPPLAEAMTVTPSVHRVTKV
ncbi:MAG: hypothetical protein ACLSD6_02095 [Clostridium sp.]